MWCWLEGAMMLPVSRKVMLVALALATLAACTTYRGRSGTDAEFFLGLRNTDFEDSAKYRNYRGDPSVLINLLETKGATCGRRSPFSSSEGPQNVQCYYVYCVNGQPGGNQWTVDGRSGALSAISLQGISLGAPSDYVCRDEQVLDLQERLASGALKGKIIKLRPAFQGATPEQILFFENESGGVAQ
jgi:hypothetical protein